MRTNVPGVRTLVLIFTLSLFSLSSFAQSITSGNGKYELGIALGPMFFLGDLGGNPGEGRGFIKDVNLPLTRFSTGLYANVYPTEWFGFRLAINRGKLEGYDNIIKDKGRDETFRKERNLQFQSTVMEAYAAVEVYPTVFFEQYEELQGKLRPYGLIGFGLFKFNPKGEYIDPATGRSKWVPLQPLHLEGQGMDEYPDRKQYKLIEKNIPMGIGAKYYLKENMYIGLEILHRTTFTDYIDDVSTNYIDANLFDKYLPADKAIMAKQLHYRENIIGTTTRPGFPDLNEQRGNPTQNDSYFSTMIRCGWRLPDPNSPGSRASRQMRCPSFY